MKKINTICIIDDDNIFTLVAKKIIQLVGASGEILLFRNGKEALKNFNLILEADKPLPELIFLDLNMPLMGGFEFLNELDKLSGTNHSKVYIFTSSIDPVDHEKAKKYRIVEKFVEKPLTVDKLKSILNELP